MVWENQNPQVTYVTDYCGTAHWLLKNAKKEVKVALYLMRYSERNQCPENLVRDLVEAKKRGVNVVVYLEDTNYNNNAEGFLREHNIPIIHPTKFLHAKILKVDDCFIVGSHNWTWNAMHKNLEASVLVCNSDVIDAFFRELDMLERAS